MRDPSIPSLQVLQPNIRLTIPQTQGTVEDQGITYNQVGIAYNQAGIAYGGLYGPSSILPTISFALLVNPSMIIDATQAGLEDQGITYNQVGIAYNQAGIAYGGLYNQNQDVAPLISLAKLIIPSIAGFVDIYTVKPTPGSNQSIGPGFFLFITH